MVRKVIIACLLCTVLLECVAARPSGCQDIHPRYSLERLIRRGAAIASSLRNLRSVRERRWGGSYPVWKTLHHTMQHRAMDITNLPSIPLLDPEGDTAAVAKDLDIGVEGFWHDEPFKFPGVVVKPPETHRPAEEPETDLRWGSFREDTPGPWGVIREPYNKCNDDMAGSPCTIHSECQGGCRDFHCSTNTNRCEPGPEPDPQFAGFF